MKIAACVILYHPLKTDLENILSYYPYVDKMYIFDNTEHENENNLFFYELPKASYVFNNSNNGLAKCLNTGCKLAIKDGFNFLLTMDQDSYFNHNTIKHYLQAIDTFSCLTSVGLFGLSYTDNQDLIKNTNNSDFLEESEIITSGSVLNLLNFDKIGGFDENLFIDGVDIDYCLATLKNNLKIIKFANLYFHHSLGETISIASFKSFYLLKKTKIIHSPIRIYYMRRNMLYLEAKYFKTFPIETSVMRKNYINHIKTNLFYAKNFWKTMLYYIQAKKDFNNKRMGKFSKLTF